MAIVSAVSSKAVRLGKEKRDIFSEVERAYIQYLKSCLWTMGKKNAQLKAQLSSALEANKKREALYSRELGQEREARRMQVASSLADLQAVRLKAADSEASRVFSASQQIARKEEADAKLRRERNLEFMSKML
jgi:hypothetical protein